MRETFESELKIALDTVRAVPQDTFAVINGKEATPPDLLLIVDLSSADVRMASTVCLFDDAASQHRIFLSRVACCTGL